jgi:hypothetical protein
LEAEPETKVGVAELVATLRLILDRAGADNVAKMYATRW